MAYFRHGGRTVPIFEAGVEIAAAILLFVPIPPVAVFDFAGNFFGGCFIDRLAKNHKHVIRSFVGAERVDR
jgi:hypothetical protein